MAPVCIMAWEHTAAGLGEAVFAWIHVQHQCMHSCLRAGGFFEGYGWGGAVWGCMYIVCLLFVCALRIVAHAPCVAAAHAPGGMLCRMLFCPLTALSCLITSPQLVSHPMHMSLQLTNGGLVAAACASPHLSLASR